MGSVRGETKGVRKEYKIGVGGIWHKRNALRGFGGETEVEEAITKLWHRWEDDIKVDVKYIERVWTRLIWFRTVASDGLLRTR